tara:strand:+ start:87435 stop:87572 length:138 start_codon:yes stop_codon:yes gene_type:complete
VQCLFPLKTRYLTKLHHYSGLFDILSQFLPEIDLIESSKFSILPE